MLNRETLEQLARYCIVGVFNTLVGLSIIYACMIFLKLPPGVSNALGFLIGLCVSYVLNRRFTFRSNAPTGRSFAIFVALVAVGYVANLLTVLGAIHYAGVDPFLAQPLGIGTYAAIVFFGSRYIAFKA